MFEILVPGRCLSPHKTLSVRHLSLGEDLDRSFVFIVPLEFGTMKKLIFAIICIHEAQPATISKIDQ